MVGAYRNVLRKASFEKISGMQFGGSLSMNIFRKLACLVLSITPLLQGCNAFAVRGSALRVPSGHVSEIVVDTSAAGGLMGSFWKSELEPAITAHTPAAFAKYGVNARTYTLVNEGAAQPAADAREAYVVRVSAKERWSGSSGTIYRVDVVFLTPTGVQLWAGTAGFAWNPIRDYDKSAQAFVENVAEQLHAAGMFNGVDARSAPTAASATGLSAGARAALEIYKSAPTPKAFVVEDGGRWISASSHGDKSDTPVADRALKACVQAGFTGCRVLAVDDTIYN